MKYYRDPTLGVIGVEPGHTSRGCTWLPNRGPARKWAREAFASYLASLRPPKTSSLPLVD